MFLCMHQTTSVAAGFRGSLEGYARGVENLREAGDIVKPLGITAMIEFMRGSTFIGTLPTALNPGPLSVELFYPHLQNGDPFEVASHIRRKAEPILQQAGVL